MEKLDQILHLQLVVARLGEKELQAWWNTDIAYKLGGAAFLAKITGTEMVPFAAGEGILAASRLKEEELVAAIPGEPRFSLFCPPLALRNELAFRFHHFKRYPDDTPAEILSILDSFTEWTVASLRAFLEKLTAGAPTDYEGTSFGRELTGIGEGRFASDEAAIQSLAAAYLGLEKGRFVLPYCRSGTDGR